MCAFVWLARPWKRGSAAAVLFQPKTAPCKKVGHAGAGRSVSADGQLFEHARTPKFVYPVRIHGVQDFRFFSFWRRRRSVPFDFDLIPENFINRVCRSKSRMSASC
ncbi:hypothetical protein FB567DRAFT_238259 [Paraphoma chrysanthemicola]|uniref:Uncharacterized protein n=1 Tax=Paraphoma chrysanthemicola TaxID=798071 RepID=A0A8K0W2F6_9PLEO|nr:hypothetical protein FB567DRAFT_238259 [Paraphoma chrysanthemicola]